MPLNPQYCWVQAKASKSAIKPYYYYNVSTRQTKWDRPSTSDSMTMVFTQREYLEAIKSGDLPKPVNRATAGKDSEASKNNFKSTNDSPFGVRQADVINEWQQNRSPDGRLYYYNTRTMETSWVKPDALKNWEDNQRKQGFDPKQVLKKTAQNAVQAKGKPIAREQITGTAWVLVWTSDNKHFFFNPTTKQSDWDTPVDLENNPEVETFLRDPPHLREPEVHSEPESEEAGESESESSEDQSDYDENAELIEKLMELPLVERMDIFQELLQEHKLTKFSVFDLECDQWKADVRYRVLKDDFERRRAFDNYIEMHVAKQEQVKRKKTPKEIFFDLLDDQNGKISKKSSFRDAQMRCARDRRWDKVEKASLRIQYFREWQMQLKTKGNLDAVKSTYMQLLKENHATEFKSWAEAKAFIKNDDRYKAVPSQAQRMAYFNEFLKNFKEEVSAVDRRNSKIAEYRREIEERNRLFREKAMVKDASITFDQILLDIFKHNASEFFKEGYIAKWENVKAQVSSDERWSTFCNDLDVRDCERIFNHHVEEVIRKARKMLKQMLDEKLPQGSSFRKDDDELWASLWLQIKADRRCIRLCGDNEQFAKREYERYQDDRFFTAKDELRELFRETKLIDWKTREKLKEQQLLKPGDKPQILREIEDILAFDSRWHALKEDKIWRGRCLNEYIDYLEERGPPDAITAFRPKAPKLSIQ